MRSGGNVSKRKTIGINVVHLINYLIISAIVCLPYENIHPRGKEEMAIESNASLAKLVIEQKLCNGNILDQPSNRIPKEMLKIAYRINSSCGPCLRNLTLGNWGNWIRNLRTYKAAEPPVKI